MDFGDGWIPWFTNYRGDPVIFDRIKELRSRTQRSIEVQVLAVPADPGTLERIRQVGARRAVHLLPSGPRDVVEKALARWEDAIAQLNGG